MLHILLYLKIYRIFIFVSVWEPVSFYLLKSSWRRIKLHPKLNPSMAVKNIWIHLEKFAYEGKMNIANISNSLEKKIGMTAVFISYLEKWSNSIV